MSGAGTILSLLIILIIPSLIWFISGPFKDHSNDEDRFMAHATIFMILAFALFIPTGFVVFGVEEGAQDAGIDIPELATGDDATDENTALTEAGTLAWIGSGVVVYWLSYIAGTNMRKVYNTSGPIS